MRRRHPRARRRHARRPGARGRRRRLLSTEAALAALARADPALGAALAAHGPPPPIPGPGRIAHETRFGALARTVLGQHHSTASAAAVHGRLVALLGGAPTPARLAARTDEELGRDAGLTRAKVRTLRELAARSADGRLDLEALDALDDEAAEATLVAIPGVGPWTAHVFLMFELRRPDVVASGDLGVREGLRRIDGAVERPSPTEVLARAEAWRPHRTLACRCCWHVAASTP